VIRTVPISTLAALGALVLFLIAQRLLELRASARHERGLRERGGHEVGSAHFPLFVVLHALYPVALAAEVLALGARPGVLWPLWLALFAGSQALRAAVHGALGERWTVRVWVVPGLPPVSHGPYRWLRHPNYLAVAVELAAGALLLGAWRTALVASVLNLVALAIRIPVEERALTQAAQATLAQGGPVPTDAGRAHRDAQGGRRALSPPP
jgi:methyltransferase